MMKQTSQSGKNVKFESLKNKFAAFEINSSIYFFRVFLIVDQNLKAEITSAHKTCCSVKRDCCITLDCNLTSEFCNKE